MGEGRESNSVFPRADGYSHLQFSELTKVPLDANRQFVIVYNGGSEEDPSGRSVENRIKLVGFFEERWYAPPESPGKYMGPLQTAIFRSTYQVNPDDPFGFRLILSEKPLEEKVFSRLLQREPDTIIAASEPGYTFFVSPPLKDRSE